MVNPYETTGSTPASPRLRPVRRFMLAACIVFAIGVLVCIPGLILLNQHLQLIPVDTHLTGIEYNGMFVSDDTAMRFSFLAGAFVIGTAVLLAYASWRNSRSNRNPFART